MKTINLKKTIQFIVVATIIMTSIIITSYFIKTIKHLYTAEQHTKAIACLLDIIQ